MQYNIKNIIASGEKVAVSVPTEEEAKQVAEIIDRDHMKQMLGTWSKYKENTFFTLDHCWMYGSILINSGNYTIIPASLFIQHNQPKSEQSQKKPFAVKAESFELYQQLKEDVEKIGWKLGPGAFSYFSQPEMTRCNCILFSETMGGKKGDYFGFTNSWETFPTYSLETKYPEAIAAAKAWFETTTEVHIDDELAELKKKYEALQKLKESLDLELNAERERVSLLEIKDDKSDCKIMDLEHDVLVLKKEHRSMFDNNKIKLQAALMLLNTFDHNSTRRQMGYTVAGIKLNLERIIDLPYSEPNTSQLPF